MAVCDRDCFHCRFEDCICDEMTAEDWREGKTVDIFVRPPTKKQLAAAAKKREYYEANRESIVGRSTRSCRSFEKEIIPWSETIKVDDKELLMFLAQLKAEEALQAETGGGDKESDIQRVPTESK